MIYAIKKGKKTGLFYSWDECKDSVIGYSNPIFQKFKDKNKAIEYLNTEDNNSYYPNQVNNGINVYTDGSCINNGKINAVAGIGIYFENNYKDSVSEKCHGKQTNNYAELYAVYKVFEILENDIKSNKIVNIFTDSSYVVKCVSTYGHKCNKNNWNKKIPNKNLVKKLYNLFRYNNNVNIYWIKAHTNQNDTHSLNNSKADLLAKSILKKYIH